MHSTHVAAEGLPSREVFIARLTVEGAGLDLRFVNSGLLCTLRFSDALAALQDSHLLVVPLLLHLLEALEQLVFLAESASAIGDRLQDSGPRCVLGADFRRIGRGLVSQLVTNVCLSWLSWPVIVGLSTILHGLLGRNDSTLVDGMADPSQVLIIDVHRLITT